MFEPIYMKKKLSGAKLDKAIAKLDELDQTTLSEVVRSAPVSEVRRAAVARLTDQALLAEIAKKRFEPLNIRKIAVEKLTDQSVLAEIAKNTDNTKDERIIAINKLTDQSALADIAQRGGSKDEQLEALKKITDQNALSEVVKATNDLDFIETALDNVTDPELKAQAYERIKKIHFEAEEKARKEAEEKERREKEKKLDAESKGEIYLGLTEEETANAKEVLGAQIKASLTVMLHGLDTNKNSAQIVMICQGLQKKLDNNALTKDELILLIQILDNFANLMAGKPDLNAQTIAVSIRALSAKLKLLLISAASKDQPSNAKTGSEAAVTETKKTDGSYAFVFMCMGPDPSGGRPMNNFSVTDRGVYEGLVQSFGFTGPRENLYFYGPSWNKTVYSSSILSGSEADDMIAKIKAEMKKKGFTYNNEPIRSTPYDPSTSYGQMGFFMVCLFVNV